jgi:hypothetical protein
MEIAVLAARAPQSAELASLSILPESSGVLVVDRPATAVSAG